MASELARQIVHAALSDDATTVRESVNEELTNRARTLIENAKPDWAASLLETDEELEEDEDFDPEDEDGDFDDEDFDDEDEDGLDEDEDEVESED